MAENWEQKIASLPEPARSEALRIAENVQGLMAFLSLPVAERISTIERLQRKAQQASGALTIGITSGTELEKHIKGVWGKTNDFTSVPAQVIYDTLVAANGIWNKESGAKWISKEEAMEVAFHAGQILEKEHAKQADSWGMGGWRAWFSAVASYVTDYVKDLINGTRETKNFSDYYDAANTQLASKTKLEDTREISVALREKLQGARYGDGKVVDSQLAQYIAGVDHQDDFVPTAASRLPAFVDPNDKTLAAGITEEQRKKNPTLADTAAKGFSGIESKEDVMHTATGVVAATAVAGGAAYTVKKVGGTAAKVVTAPLSWGANHVAAAARGVGILSPAAAPVHSMTAAMSQPASVAAEAIGSSRAGVVVAEKEAAKGLLGRAAAKILPRLAASGASGPAAPIVGGAMLLWTVYEVAEYAGLFATKPGGNIKNAAEQGDVDALALFTAVNTAATNPDVIDQISDPVARDYAIAAQKIVEHQAKIIELKEQGKMKDESGTSIERLQRGLAIRLAEFDGGFNSYLTKRNVFDEGGKVNTANAKQITELFTQAIAKAEAKAEKEKAAPVVTQPAPAGDKVSSAAPIPADALLAAREGVIAQARAAASKENKVALVSETPTPFARVSEVKLMGVLPADTLPASGNPLPTGVSAKAEVAAVVAAG